MSPPDDAAAGLAGAEAFLSPFFSPPPSPRTAFAAKAPPNSTTAARAPPVDPLEDPLAFFVFFAPLLFAGADLEGAAALEEDGAALGAGAVVVLPSLRFFSASASVPEKRLDCTRLGSTFWYRELASRAGDDAASASGTAPARSESDTAPATASLSAGEALSFAEATPLGAATARGCFVFEEKRWVGKSSQQKVRNPSEQVEGGCRG